MCQSVVGPECSSRWNVLNLFLLLFMLCPRTCMCVCVLLFFSPSRFFKSHPMDAFLFACLQICLQVFITSVRIVFRCALSLYKKCHSICMYLGPNESLHSALHSRWMQFLNANFSQSCSIAIIDCAALTKRTEMSGSFGWPVGKMLTLNVTWRNLNLILIVIFVYTLFVNWFRWISLIVIVMFAAFGALPIFFTWYSIQSYCSQCVSFFFI